MNKYSLPLAIVVFSGCSLLNNANLNPTLYWNSTSGNKGIHILVMLNGNPVDISKPIEMNRNDKWCVLLTNLMKTDIFLRKDDTSFSIADISPRIRSGGSVYSKLTELPEAKTACNVPDQIYYLLNGSLGASQNDSKPSDLQSKHYDVIVQDGIKTLEGGTHAFLAFRADIHGKITGNNQLFHIHKSVEIELIIK